MSLLVVSAVTQELQRVECIYSSAAQCESHYRPLTFMALVERRRASCESSMERCVLLQQ